MTVLKKMMIIFKNIIISYFILVILAMIYALILAYTNVPETTMTVATFVLSIISVFIGSSLSLIKIKENGILNGGIFGLLFIIILYILSSIFVTGFGINSFASSMIVLNVLIGMIGGIIGVNFVK